MCCTNRKLRDDVLDAQHDAHRDESLHVRFLQEVLDVQRVFGGEVLGGVAQHHDDL